jgi:hypothetical protein
LDDEKDLHRRFGAQLNNRSWDLLDAGLPNSSSPESERLEFLYGAFASAYHWGLVGGPAQIARAEHLISRVALRVGELDLASAHASRCHRLVTENRAAVEDWDLGFALEALARSMAAQGDLESAARLRAEALEVAASVANPEDRAVLEAEITKGEWFGL